MTASPILVPEDAAALIGMRVDDLLASDCPRFALGKRTIRFVRASVLAWADGTYVELTPDDAHYNARRVGPPLRRGAFLYFLHNPVTQLIKIGITDDVRKRQQSLECAGGVRLTLLASLQGAHTFERALHKLFHEDRAVGEWFRPSNALYEITDLVRRTQDYDEVRRWIDRGGKLTPTHLRQLATEAYWENERMTA